MKNHSLKGQDANTAKNEIRYAPVFSNNYQDARQRFLKAARSVNADLSCHLISARGAQGEDLSIDIASVGSKNPKRTILLTCGLHGIEGFPGSAIQTAWLEKLYANPIALDDTAVVLVHALNPYGFSWQRRVNENNVDLNRNFILPDQQFAGSPLCLSEMPWMQKPMSPENKFFNINFFVIWPIIKYGFATIRNSIQYGQFDYPQGLFWGGHQHEQTSKIIMEQINSWTKNAPNIFQDHLTLLYKKNVVLSTLIAL